MVVLLATAHMHHMALRSPSPDVWCTMHVMKQTKWSMSLNGEMLMNEKAKQIEWYNHNEMVTCDGLQCVIEVFPDHTHLS